MTRRRAGVVGLVAMVGVALAASVAWACTAISTVYQINPTPAPAGASVEVTGREFWSRTVEARWNSVDGLLLGSGMGGSEFTITFKVPDVAPGDYWVYLVQSDSTNPRTPFRVSAPAGSGASERNTSTANTAGADPDGEPAWVDDGAGVDASSSPGPDQVGAGGAAPSPASATRRATSASPATSAGPANAATASPAPGASGVDGAAVATSPPAPAESGPALVGSRRSASGEVLFSSAPTEAGAALSVDEAGPKRDQSGPAMGFGVALLAVGLAGLAGATTVVGRRRLSAAAGADSSEQAWR